MSILYTNAILSVRSSVLLNPDRIRRMIAAGSDKDAQDILMECKWSLDTINIFETERQKTLDEFNKLCPDPNLAEIINAKSSFDADGNTDLKLIQNYYDAQFKRLKKLKNKFITDFFVAQIDLLNLRTFAKVRSMGGRPENLFIDGGKITESECQEVFRRNPHNIKSAIANMDYSDLLDKLVDGLEGGILTEFENASNQYLINLARKDGDDSFKLNPIFHWFISKTEEIRIAKTIIMGKKFGKTRDAIREELRGVI